MVGWYRGISISRLLGKEKLMVTETQLDNESLDKPEHDVEGFDKPVDDKMFTIQIDRVKYEVEGNRFSGAKLRQVPTPPIPPDRDIFEIIPGAPDRKIEDEDRFLIADGQRFFTAPNTINPGSAFAAR